ncbi:nuclear pore complex subunit Nro1-domain-containing protein [Dimargaris cristalligena]|uniref:Nuclear pore complex subunit Nro1-domain-containing protein n=1 Tax=Dimargaris cristalligena TaxID=215637 RepID=A0A4P9ZUW1_9FUNG|nr:nuclear pore complex subunit Nro1-domain-containing protein [Dimargaris cristalligena]|eukprot:RKP36602.1 nuclear pore complex subunit Nro1-domain-containing protein [Dimargaris cristalligena]
MTNPAKRRPGGLKRALAGEDTVPTADGPSAGKASRTTPDSDMAAQDELSVPLQLTEGSDELDELKELYDTAFDTLKSDGDRAVTLLRGVVHESDRLLRRHDQDNDPLPPHFYWIYGMALFCLSELNEGEEALGFLQMAESHFERGLERLNTTPTTTLVSPTTGDPTGDRLQLPSIQDRLRLAQAKAQLGQARAMATEDEPASRDSRGKLIGSATRLFAAVIQHSRQDPAGAFLAEPLLIQEASLLQSYVDVLTEWEEVESLNNKMIAELEASIQDRGNDSDAESDNGEDSDTENERHVEIMQNALPYLLKSHEGLVKARDLFEETDPELVLLLLTLGEVLINLGNCVEISAADADADDDDDDNESSDEPSLAGLTQSQYYEQAVAAFNRAREIGGDDYMLPEQFEQFLQDWEAELQEA